MMKKVLIICPRFPPKNAPDHHRVRTSLPYFRQNGWEPTVLCVTPETSDGTDDPALLETVPADVRLIRVAAWPENLCRKFGFGHMDFRCLWPLYRAGVRLLATEKFDAIFFSTTSFLTFVLGRLWKRRFKTAVVFDFQDPWFNASHGYNRQNAPGGWTKFQIVQRIARHAEPFALRAADHVIAVSPGYVRDLSRRYAWLKPEQFSVIPFGAAARDFELVKTRRTVQAIFNREDGLRHWVYVGAVVPAMEPALSALFAAVAKWKQCQPATAQKLRLHFVGTNYAPAHRTFKRVEPLAARFGLQDVVEEHSERIPYLQALAVMADSDAVLLVGSASADYTASKLFNCVMSGKPILAMFHEQSLVAGLAGEFPGIRFAGFKDDPRHPDFQKKADDGVAWLAAAPAGREDWRASIAPHTAEAYTAKICAIFDRVVK